jgi:hypothetical protein
MEGLKCGLFSLSYFAQPPSGSLTCFFIRADTAIRYGSKRNTKRRKSAVKYDAGRGFEIVRESQK